jgi:hypothetical protein
MRFELLVLILASIVPQSSPVAMKKMPNLHSLNKLKVPTTSLASAVDAIINDLDVSFVKNECVSQHLIGLDSLGLSLEPNKLNEISMSKPKPSDIMATSILQYDFTDTSLNQIGIAGSIPESSKKAITQDRAKPTKKRVMAPIKKVEITQPKPKRLKEAEPQKGVAEPLRRQLRSSSKFMATPSVASIKVDQSEITNSGDGSRISQVLIANSNLRGKQKVGRPKMTRASNKYGTRLEIQNDKMKCDIPLTSESGPLLKGFNEASSKPMTLSEQIDATCVEIADEKNSADENDSLTFLHQNVLKDEHMGISSKSHIESPVPSVILSQREAVDISNQEIQDAEASIDHPSHVALSPPSSCHQFSLLLDGHNDSSKCQRLTLHASDSADIQRQPAPVTPSAPTPPQQQQPSHSYSAQSPSDSSSQPVFTPFSVFTEARRGPPLPGQDAEAGEDAARGVARRAWYTSSSASDEDRLPPRPADADASAPRHSGRRDATPPAWPPGAAEDQAAGSPGRAACVPVPCAAWGGAVAGGWEESRGVSGGWESERLGYGGYGAGKAGLEAGWPAGGRDGWGAGGGFATQTRGAVVAYGGRGWRAGDDSDAGDGPYPGRARARGGDYGAVSFGGGGGGGVDACDSGRGTSACGVGMGSSATAWGSAGAGAYAVGTCGRADDGAEGAEEGGWEGGGAGGHGGMWGGGEALARRLTRADEAPASGAVEARALVAPVAGDSDRCESLEGAGAGLWRGLVHARCRGDGRAGEGEGEGEGRPCESAPAAKAGEAGRDVPAAVRPNAPAGCRCELAAETRTAATTVTVAEEEGYAAAAAAGLGAATGDGGVYRAGDAAPGAALCRPPSPGAALHILAAGNADDAVAPRPVAHDAAAQEAVAAQEAAAAQAAAVDQEAAAAQDAAAVLAAQEAAVAAAAAAQEAAAAAALEAAAVEEAGDL